MLAISIFGRPWADVMGSMSGTQTFSWNWESDSQHMAMYVVGFGQGRVEVEVEVKVNGESVSSKRERGNFYATIDLGKFEKGQLYGISLEWKTRGSPWQGMAFCTDEYPDGKVPKSPFDSKDPCVFARLAEALVDCERTNEARLLLDIILKKSPNCSYAWHAKGELMAYWQDPRQAQDAYERAIKLNPKEATAMRGLGSSLASTGQLRKSKEMYRLVLDYPEIRYYDFGVSLSGYLLFEVIDDKLKDAREFIEALQNSVRPDTYNGKSVAASLLLLDKYEGKDVTLDRSDNLLRECLGDMAHQIRLLSNYLTKSGKRESVQTAIHLARAGEKLLPDM